MDESSRIQLSRSVGGVGNTDLIQWAPTFDEMRAELSRPSVGPKDGSYFVRGPFNGTAKRADQHITEANCVILDGDSRVNPETGELLDGAPHPILVHEALTDADVRHIVYTSHSHGDPKKGDRYRVVVPAALGSDHCALLACVDHLIGIVGAAGVPLANVKENYTWAQPWYLPRIRAKGAEFLHFVHDTDEEIDTAGILASWTRAQPPQPDVAPDAKRPKSANTLIGKYVAEHGDPAKMAERMTKAGYILKSAGHLNGSPCYRYLHPESTSGAPGAVLFRTRAGTWRVCSHHGDYDKLAESEPKTGKRLAHDAFDLFRIFDHGGSLKDALRAIDPRPVILVYGGSFQANTEQTIRALARLEPPSVFQRGSMLARVAHLPEPTDVAGVIVPKGTATLIELNSVSMRLKMADAAIWQTPKKAKDGEPPVLVDCNPPGDVANAVIASAGDWAGLPVLAAVTEAPILRPDGSVRDTAGYDPMTRLYYDGRAPTLAISSNPDREEALRACAYLLRPFAEFPFAEPARDQSVMLAYLLTLAQRQLMALAPLFCVSATAPGTGKGLLIEACNLIVRGRDAAIMPPPGGQDAEAETRKRITALMVQGVSSVLLDNWTSAIGGDSMNMLLTSESWTDRVLGQSKTVTLPARVTWSATGNNLSVRGDMVRRTVLAVIDAATERPEQREFKVRNLQSHVLDHRADLLGALFTILRAYRLAGEPEKDGPTLGRFEPWSRAVAAPIRWLGFPDPTESQDRLRSDDPEIQKLGALLCGWVDVFGNRQVTIAEVIDVVTADFPPNGATGAARFALKEALEDAAGDRPGQINRKKLGWYLRHFNGRVCDGLRLDVDSSRKDRAKYRVVSAT